MPKVVDDARGDEEVAVLVVIESPWIAGALAEEFERLRARMIPPTRAGELVRFALMFDLGVIEDAVESVEPAVRTPDERIGKLVRVVASEAGEQHFASVGFTVAVGVFHEEQIGRIADE